MPGTNSIDGISSGFDTSSIVGAIISSERRNAVFLENDQALKTGIVSALQALQAKFIALKSSLTLLSRESAFEKYNVNISDDEVLTATTQGRVGVGSYDLQVLSLARNHQLASQGFDSSAQNTFGTGTITLQVGDGTARNITIDSSNNSLDGVRKAINDADAGVTASIINDGSSKNSYRMILSSDKTGLDNKITMTSSLTGGDNFNFSTASFDVPEIQTKNLATTSQVALFATAAFTGNENKTYTFTVTGVGSQTVGSGSILIDWNDGTNQGTISVTQADTEVILAGAGSDGLTLSFTAGNLTAGDVFEVSTFAPLLQAASDSKIAFGTAGGTGSPITVTSSTNTFEDVISGLSVTVKKETAPTSKVTITTDTDTDSIRNQIQSFIDQYNNIQEFIDNQNTYDTDSKESGILAGDYSIMSMQSSLRMAVASVTKGITSKYNQLFAIGIRSNSKGQLEIKDSSALNDALKNNLDDVIKLFTTSGDSDSNYISLIIASEKIEAGRSFAVDVTKAASHGGYVGATIGDPGSTPLTLTSANNKLQLIVDGTISDEIALTTGTYNSTADLINEIQGKLDADAKVGSLGASVQWVDDGNGQGHLLFESNKYGDSSYVDTVASLSDNAYLAIGLLTGAKSIGQNVEGTINGEAAEGKGQYLTGKDDNDTTDGLKLKITFTADQLVAGSEGSITISKGVATRMEDIVESLTKASEGTFYRKISTQRKQIELLKDRVEEIDERLELRRESLYEQFYAMEQALAKFTSQGQFLSSQLASINAGWRLINS